MATNERPSHRRISGTRRPRVNLTLEAIIEQACIILDAEGPDALTLRRLASELGAGVTSLYWYIDNKDDLLDLCYHHAIDDAAERLFALPINVTEWRTYLYDLCQGIFEPVEAHPWVADLISRNYSLGNVVLGIWERIGATLNALRLDEQIVLSGIAALANHIGSMGAQLEGASVRQQRLNDRATTMAALDQTEFPYLTKHAELFRTPNAHEQFLTGLDIILDGIAVHVAAQTENVRASNIQQ